MTLHTNAKRYGGLLALPLILLALWPEWVDFFQLWNDSIIYHHGFLVAGGIVFLLYLRMDALSNLQPTGSAIALLLLVGALAALVLSQAAEIRVFRLLLTPCVIVLWGWSIWGFRFVRVAGGPIMLLVFAAPIWDDFSPLLQHITVFFNQIFLDLADIPATIKEFFIILEVGTFLVEDGCSGVRYLMVALFLGAFYGELHYRNYWRIATLVVIAGLLSMIANWIRVFGIIAASHYTDMETSLVEDHEMFGWVVFILVTLLPLYFISGKLEENGQSHVPQPQSETPQPGTMKWPVIATIVLLLPFSLPHILAPRIAETGNDWTVTLPDLKPDWRGPLNHADFWQPLYINADIERSGVYVAENLAQVQLYVTGYRTQNSNKELIAYDNSLFSKKIWSEVSRSVHDLPVQVSNSPRLVNELILKSKTLNQSHLIIWYWYQVGNEMTASATQAKLMGGVMKLAGDNRGALWALASPCDNKEQCQSRQQDLEKFLTGLSL